MTRPSYSYVELDLDDPDHQTALFNLMNAYMLDRMGCEKPLHADSFKELVCGLKNQANYLGVLVKSQGKYIALSNCFVNFSTFKMSPLINIHDLIVLPDYRGKGVGRFLIQSVKAIARKRDCCKITLEVRNDNKTAQNLYLSKGFKECNPPMYFWEATIDRANN
ncbi:GNAT family N-acetyltransferase [Labilibaculum sp. K2S]|uniref:GNAT family N-acetyltransferase n=1 Tax=Labilibaculum sp. K2S TaxID=3056386 RepID=UPI0025A325B0|nr:GNAT family N-acetyltransferase [Labilibaculum sp. K2S]MDM8160549.1 GNAT family N-acetyltransferase [Labilibaculum sp. K2S]